MQAINKKKAPSILAALILGTFMSALDTSVVNIALPIIQNHFHTSLSIVEWVVISYLLITSSTLLTFGRLSDLYGHKKIYLTGFVIFTVGSLLCGFSGHIGMLVSFRIFQAIGASMMFSTNSAIITNNTPAENRGKAFGIIAITVAAACCLGPILGGILTDAFGWQSVFFINIPIGVLGIFLASKNIPSDKASEAVPFDKTGSILIFAALFLILLPLDLSGSGNMPVWKFYTMLISGLVLTVSFIVHEQKTNYPLLKLSLFRNRVFSASLAAAVFNYMTQFMMVLLIPFYLEKLRLFSPATAGLLYIPMPIATMLAAPVCGSISDRYDSRIMSSCGMGVMAVSMFMLSFLKPDTSNWYIIIAMILAGLGSGMFQAPNNSAIMGSAPMQYRGAASGTLATMRNIGMVMGIAVSGTVFNFFLNKSTEAFKAKGLSGIELNQATFSYGLHITFMLAAFIALLAMTASLVKGKTKASQPVSNVA